MGVNVRWDEVLNNLVVFEFVEPWTWIEYEAAHKQAYQMEASINGPVNAVFDFRGSGNIPAGALSKFAEMVKRLGLAPNLEQFILITNKRYLLQLLHVYNAVFNKRKMRFDSADSLESARKKLTKY